MFTATKLKNGKIRMDKNGVVKNTFGSRPEERRNVGRIRLRWLRDGGKITDNKQEES